MSRNLALALALAVLLATSAAAQEQGTVQLQSPETGVVKKNVAAPLHPPIKLLDGLGKSVLASGAPVSAELSCGECHDTDYIADHNYHSDAGIEARNAGTAFACARPWDLGPGMYGRFDPLTYTVTRPEGVAPPQADSSWLERLGFRYTGGAAGMLPPGGPYEFDCFICHLEQPDNAARIAELKAGRFAWALTATLGRTGIATRTAGGWSWNATLIRSDGTVTAEQLKLTRARASHCGQCHGTVYTADGPLALKHNLLNWSTETTGQVFAAQRLTVSGLNLQNKADLARPWDVHAERLLECADCHNAPNNPILYREMVKAPVANLSFDPRRPSLSAYFDAPHHDFMLVGNAQTVSKPDARLRMRGCADCHTPLTTHRKWLPYARRHMQVLECETCHIPRIYAPARSATDWTMPTPAGEPHVSYRGAAQGTLDSENVDDPGTLLSGYRPILLPRRDPDGASRLGPYNLALAWYWVGDVRAYSGSKTHPEPVTLERLKQAFTTGGGYSAAILQALDTDQDGKLSDKEAVLDSKEKVQAAAAALEAAGVANPRIVSELAPYDLHHDIAGIDFATRNCRTCHGRGSILTAPMQLASADPGGGLLQLEANPAVRLAGSLARDGGGLRYVPSLQAEGLYILGLSRFTLGDRIGAVLIVLTLLAVLIHGGARAALKLRRMREAKQ